MIARDRDCTSLSPPRGSSAPDRGQGAEGSLLGFNRRLITFRMRCDALGQGGGTNPCRPYLDSDMGQRSSADGALATGEEGGGGRKMALASGRGRRSRCGGQDLNMNFTQICSCSEAGSYLKLIDFVYHSTRGLIEMKKKKKVRVGVPTHVWGLNPGPASTLLVPHLIDLAGKGQRDRLLAINGSVKGCSM